MSSAEAIKVVRVTRKQTSEARIVTVTVTREESRKATSVTPVGAEEGTIGYE